MSKTKSSAALGLSVSMVGLMLGSFGSSGLTPAGAQTVSVSAFDQAVSKVSANQALTTTDMEVLKDQVKKVTPGVTDQFFNAAFYAYSVGQPQYVQAMPVSSTTSTVADPPSPSGGAASVDTVAYDGYYVGGFTVTRKFFSVLGFRLASFSQHVEAGDAAGQIYPTPNAQDTNVDVTGNGSYGGWYFDRYNDIRNAAVKWNNNANGSWVWNGQALFRQCVAGYCNAWDPKIVQIRYAAGLGTDANWHTDEAPGDHFMLIGRRVA